MPARLTISFTTRPAKTFLAREGHDYTLGRGAECDFVIDSEQVSRRHALLAHGDDGWQIRDLGSKNGLSVNGLAAREAVLDDSCWLSIGGVIAEFRRVDESDIALERDARLQRFRTTLTAQRSLSPALGLERLLEGVLDSVREVSGAQRGFVLLQSGEGYKVLASTGITREEMEAAEFAGSAGAVQRALDGGETVVHSDARLDTLLGDRPSILAGEIRALVCLPLTALDRVIGAVYLDSREIGTAFDELDVEILEAMTSHAALAISVAQVEDEIRSLADEHPALQSLTIRRAAAPTVAGPPGKPSVVEIPSDPTPWRGIVARHKVGER